jgi:large subunit ribosomal protein L2
MFLKKFKPFINSIRHRIIVKKNSLSKKNRIIKFLSFGLKRFVGRSSSNGRITVRHRGGGRKKIYTSINFCEKIPLLGLVISNSYDPYRTSFMSLIFNYLTNNFLYVLSTHKVYSGSIIYNTFLNYELKLGCSFNLFLIPSGSTIHSLSESNDKICFIRSAGTFGQIIQKNKNKITIKLPSGDFKTMINKSFATLGIVSNIHHSSTVLGSAGKKRILGFRPHVRGVAMNPVDHPHGGRTNGGRPSVTPWGIPTKGKPTVKKKNAFK